MKQVFSTNRGVEVIEVPSPALLPGHVLVEVEYSLVSSGTEMATVEALETPRPSHMSQVAQSASMNKLARYLREHGIKKTVSRVVDRLSPAPEPPLKMAAIGYSCSGRVLAVGEGVTLFEPGDLVACAGARKATHSELVVVPENLTVKIPSGGDAQSSASVAVGAIAMQGVRRSGVQLGETVAVIGLGLVGLIAMQLLKLAGARVIGFDLDSARVEHARRLGIDEAYSDIESALPAVNRFTKHMGVDVCLVTAGSTGSEIVQLAMEVTRKKGRVAVVGLIGMDIQQDPFLRKEIDFAISSSYGPGRYDDTYEEKGMDYPFAYVRWTEKRNMEEYLRLLAEKKVDILSFVQKVPLESSVEAFQRLKNPSERPVAVLIEYESDRPAEQKNLTRIDVTRRPKTDRVRIGIAGAGKFVRQVHLPSIERLGDRAEIGAIVTRTGAASMEIASNYDAAYAATSYDEILNDTDTDAVLIGTRHNLHAEMTLQALRAGKHALVEKPLAMTDDELAELESYFASDSSNSSPVLLTGFNRRFSPLIVELKKLLDESGGPIIMTYQMNAGYLPETHWLRTDEGGGRNIGEACHIYDLFTYLTNAQSTRVSVAHANFADATHAPNENFTASVSFENGSIGTLTFTSDGSNAYPKEMMHVYSQGTVYVLTDYRKLEVFGKPVSPMESERQDKGHFDEMKAFVSAISAGSGPPIPLWQQFQATRIALEVENQIRGISGVANTG